MSMGVRVLASGLLTTVQDNGRHGWRHLGVGRAGALDIDAASLANRLVGNAEAAAVLELTVSGPQLQWPRAVRIAVCGAQVPMTFEDVDGNCSTLACSRPIVLPAGTLQLGAIRDGARAWLAFAGGIDVPAVLGSRSTDLRGGFGGYHGRALQAGDVLPLGAAEADITCIAPVLTRWWIDCSHEARDTPLRYVASNHPSAARLVDAAWRVDPRSNRQGLRLAGVALPATDLSQMLSAAVAPGTVQLPPDGQPIILLADAQTVGGYPRLGHVIAADLPRLAQCRPGDVLRFAAIDAQAAADLALRHRTQQARLHHAIADHRS